MFDVRNDVRAAGTGPVLAWRAAVRESWGRFNMNFRD